METRTIYELLILLRDNARVKKSYFGLKQRIEFGLCCEVDSMHNYNLINFGENRLLIDYIRKNKPHIKHSLYGWAIYLWLPRNKWLNQQIKLTKPSIFNQDYSRFDYCLFKYYHIIGKIEGLGRKLATQIVKWWYCIKIVNKR